MVTQLEEIEIEELFSGGTDSPVRNAGREALADLGLWPTEAGFEIIDGLADSLRERLGYQGDLDRWAVEASDWESASSPVISFRTYEQIKQWTDLGLYGADLGDVWFSEPSTEPEVLIASQLAAVVYTVASAMVRAVEAF